MRLSDFIAGNREPILVEWGAFACTCAPVSGAIDIDSMRYHANEMLSVDSFPATELLNAEPGT